MWVAEFVRKVLLDADILSIKQPISAFLFDENKDGEDTLLTSDELYHHYVLCDVKFKPPHN